MASIIGGIGTAHAPQLSTPPTEWGQRVAADKTHPGHPFRGEKLKFEELVAKRADEGIEGQYTLEEWSRRFEQAQAGLDQLRQAYLDFAPDVTIIIGNDQREMFPPTQMLPAVSIYAAEEMINKPSTPEHIASLPPGVAVAERGHAPETKTVYPVNRPLALHLADHLVGAQFDLNLMHEMPDHAPNGAPHSLGFIYRRIMGDDVGPHVPLIINTFFPPTSPHAARCYELGQALKTAIEAWPRDERILLIGSGGLSHFVIDERLDERIIAAMKKHDGKALGNVEEYLLQSGSSEWKTWFPVAGAMDACGYDMEMIDYIPCYRSAAGTGTAVGFAVWKP